MSEILLGFEVGTGSPIHMHLTHTVVAAMTQFGKCLAGDSARANGGSVMGCGCMATIGENDERAALWLYVFGSRTFPLKHLLPVNMGRVVGISQRRKRKRRNPKNE
jgi:hypothetical protein